nr:hypothetical protein [Tanacetum cinerariifolium]
MEDTMLELVKICRQKELLCIHDNVEDLIESALNTKHLSINSQRLEKEKQEVKEVVEQPAERGNRTIESLQNFRVIHFSLNNTSHISPVHAASLMLRTFYQSQVNARSSSKFDFSGELAHVNPEITESDFHFEEEIHLSENLLHDNSSSQPPEEHNVDEERIKREHAEYISHAEFDFKPDSEEEIPVVINKKDEFDDDYSLFMFVIQIFLHYLICSKMFLSFLAAESEDTIFDLGIFA